MRLILNKATCSANSFPGFPLFLPFQRMGGGGGREEGEMFLGTNLHERKSSSERSEKSSDSDDDFQSRGEKFKHSHRRHSFFRMDQEDQEVLCALNLLVTYLLQLNN